MGFKRKRISKTKPVRSADSDEEAEIDFIQNIYDEDSNLYYISKKLNKAGINLEDELECEKNPRFLKQSNLRALLPIKKDGKIIPIFDAKPKVVYADDVPTPVQKKKTEKQPIQNFENLEEFKIYLSRVSNQILSNPEQNIHSIAKLIRYLQCKSRPFILSQDNSVQSQDVNSQKAIILIIASLTEIFRDIIPGYKIRKATEQEKDQMAKKETRELRKFEELLLNYYCKFFGITKRFATQKKYRTAKTIQTSVLIIARSQLIIQSWGELIRCKPHFNCNKDIIHALVPNLNHKVEKIREVAMDVIKSILLKGDAGNNNNVSLSLEIVQAINQYLRAKKFRGVRPDVLDALLWLKIDDINAHIAAQMSQFKESELKARKLKKADATKGKRDKFSKKKVVSATNKKMSTGDAAKKFLSRKQFKKSKALEQFKREVDTLGNAVSLNYHKHKNDATICNTIFTIYFKILRSFHQTYHNNNGDNDLNDDNTVNDNKRLSGKSIALLSAALRGLAQFARLINIEMFHDLIDTLYQISINKELNIRDRLNAIYTTFVILRGGQHQYTAAFNIDMNRFYQSLYSLLFNSQTGPANAATKFTITDLIAFAKCLDICFIKGSSSASSLNNLNKSGHRTMPKYSAETLVARLLKPDERLQMIRVSAFIQRLCYIVENLTEFCCIPSSKCTTYNMTCNAGNSEGIKTFKGIDNNDKLIANDYDLFQSILFTLMAKLLQAFPTCLHLLSNNFDITSTTNKLQNQIDLLSAFEFTANQTFAIGLDHYQVINGVKWIHNIILNVCSQKSENANMPKNIDELSSTNIMEVFLLKGLTPWMYKTIDTLQKMEMTENGLPLSSVQSQTTNNSYQRIVQNFHANTYSHCLEKAYKILIHSQTTGTTTKWPPRDFWKPFCAFSEATPQNSKFHKKQKSLKLPTRSKN